MSIQPSNPSVHLYVRLSIYVSLIYQPVSQFLLDLNTHPEEHILPSIHKEKESRIKQILLQAQLSEGI